ncbi:MAG: hypothetical protein AAGJ68_15185, partial [Pseudomonadota bacterium]
MTKLRASKMRGVATIVAVVCAAGMVTACGGGGSGGSPAGGASSVSPPPPPPPSPPPPPPPPPPASSVDISGQITWDKVPHQSDFTGLDYNAITQEPARGVTVQAVNGSGAVLDTDITDDNGGYSVTVDSDTDVRIQVRSELIQTTGARWDIQILDNTSSNAIYVLAGSLTNSGTSNSTRSLNAASGWDGSSYSGTRAAAPFAILDTMYSAVMSVAAVDPNVVFPELDVLWSVNNVPVSGDVSAGEIGTSSYTRSAGGTPTIRILGAENNDTDEYDSHVVVHEFGHYFEDQISRAESTGGQHSLSSRLDARLAFSEGWSNALAGIVLGDPTYRDSLNNQQASGFSFSVESDLTNVPNTSIDNQGWYNETSVQQILYDIFDSTNDGLDTISGGFGPFYNVYTDPDYLNSVDFTTIFLFADRLRSEGSINTTVLNQLLTAEDINGTGPRGVGETNN